MPAQIYTIGHSTRTFEDFAALLAAHGIVQVADIRRFPGSRRHPHFSRERLQDALAQRGVAYRHFPSLGGLRQPRSDSPNVGWRNASFRGYADYMQTPEFAAGVEDLLAFSNLGPTAVMCAEAVWWRCHRALLADALWVRGIPVRHILDGQTAEAHQLCDFAATDGLTVTYPEDGRAAGGARGNRSTS